MIGTKSHIAVRMAGLSSDSVRREGAFSRWLGWSVLLGSALIGCSHGDSKKLAPSELYVTRPITIAVAPALNHSGSSAFDEVKVADLMASELGSVRGLRVIGVNRVLAVLAEQGVDQIQSAQHALAVCERLGADVILVFAITEYDPYTPVVGMAVQLFGPRTGEPILDPVAASRMARPLPIDPRQEATRPWGQMQRTFNAAHQAIRDEVKDYARTHGADQGPYRWRRYLVSQEFYLRFCCYSAARELMEQLERDGVTTLAQATAGR